MYIFSRSQVDAQANVMYTNWLAISNRLSWSRSQRVYPFTLNERPVEYRRWWSKERPTHRFFQVQPQNIELLGFCVHMGGNPGESYQYFAIPSWFLTLFFAAFPLVRVHSLYRTRKRKKLGLCLTCGYDLRGTPGDRCPECGSPTPPTASAPPQTPASR